jgi:hypothetical protein
MPAAAAATGLRCGQIIISIPGCLAQEATCLRKDELLLKLHNQWDVMLK